MPHQTPLLRGCKLQLISGQICRTKFDIFSSNVTVNDDTDKVCLFILLICVSLPSSEPESQLNLKYYFIYGREFLPEPGIYPRRVLNESNDSPEFGQQKTIWHQTWNRPILTRYVSPRQGVPKFSRTLKILTMYFTFTSFCKKYEKNMSLQPIPNRITLLIVTTIQNIIMMMK